jgi:hypothetical protein
MITFTTIAKSEIFLGLERSVRKFKSIARKNRRQKRKTKFVILAEHRRFFIDYISLLSFLPAAIDHYDANLFVYEIAIKNKIQQLKKRIMNNFSVLKSIAHCKFIFIISEKTLNFKHQEIVNDLFSNNVSKQSFENFYYRNILIGDLIYDFYLRKFKVVTLDLNDINLKSIVFEYLQYVDEFIKFFDKNEVKAVIASHSTYGYGIPLRVAALYQVDAFVVMDILTPIRVTPSELFPHTQNFRALRAKFELLTLKSQEKAKEYAKERINLRLLGERVDLRLSPSIIDWNSIEFQEIKLLSDNNNKYKYVCLIALHDFVDAVHRYGNNFYPDFWEWIVGIGMLTRNMPVKFLLKPHPNAQFNPYKQLNEICEIYPQFQIISGSVNNLELINMGVTHCMTVHGHIASEMASLGVVTINAGKVNPHMDYSFSFTPKTLNDFQWAVQNMELVNSQIDQSEIYEFYFSHHILNLVSWVIPNVTKLWEEFGTARIVDNKSILNYYLTSDNKFNIICLENAAKKFISSNDLIMERKHFGSNLCAKEATCKCHSVYSFNGVISYKNDIQI